MAHGNHTEIKQENFQVPAKARTFAIILAVLGLVLAGIGIATMNRSGHDVKGTHAVVGANPDRQLEIGDATEVQAGHEGTTGNKHHSGMDDRQGDVHNPSMDEHHGTAPDKATTPGDARTHDVKAKDVKGARKPMMAHADGKPVEAKPGGQVPARAEAEGHHAADQKQTVEVKHTEVIADGHAAGHAEHGNIETEEFGPRATFPVLHKPWTTRIWAGLLVNGYFWLIIALAGFFFMVVQYIANAGWATAILRIPQAIGTFIPLPFAVVLLVLLVAKTDIYHWAHYEHLHITDKHAAGYDPILAGKSAFLNTGMMFGMLIVLVGTWIFIAAKLRKFSRLEDDASKGETRFFKRSIGWSAAYAVIYGFLFSIVSWLIVMSVDAHWYSTIFGVYNFATGWVSALSIICLFVLYLRSLGYLKIVTDEHVHDLGKFMFAFSIFWTYLWTSQYLLIWYAQIPEEVAYFQIRFEQYRFNFFLNLALNFVFPFLALMTRNGKRNPYIVGFAGLVIIVGHWHDVWLMMYPGIFGPGMQVGLFEIGVFLIMAGIFVYWVLTALSKRNLIPVNHPYIEESAHHDVGV